MFVEERGGQVKMVVTEEMELMVENLKLLKLYNNWI
jgi:hypothetical protein